MEAGSEDWLTAYDRITRFLIAIGLEPAEEPIPPSPLLPGVAIVSGRLVVDRESLIWPGDLLHEAGHIAVTPAALRATLGGRLGEEPAALHAGEAEAMAWSYAAVLASGLEPRILFHVGGYRGASERLALTYACGCYPGVSGLASAGLTVSLAEGAARGLAPYPHMLRWLRE